MNHPLIHFTALGLADEYGIKLWIAALLDPEPITHGTNNPDKYIQSPPPFHLQEAANGIGRTPEKAGKRSTRAQRSMRSASPSKAKATPRKIATPRRARKTRGASASVDESASVKDDDHLNGDVKDTVKVEVENTMVPDVNGVEQVESTKVNVEVPANHPDLEIPESAEEMLAQARDMVKEASKIGPSGKKGKRKASEIEEDEDEVALSRPTKKARPQEIELRKEKIRRRALTGIAGTLVVG